METLTRAEAIELGSARYFTGKPCPSGHVAERFVSTRGCTACTKAKTKKSRQEDPQKWRSYGHSQYTNNREKELYRQREYQKKNSDKISVKNKQRYELKRESIIDAARKYRLENREIINEKQRNRYRANRDKLKLRNSKWRKANRHRVAFYVEARRASRKARTPEWFGEFDELVFREAAHLVCIREAHTGIKWHVDHIIPLSAADASGLHVWNNCQVIPAKLNSSKGNRMILLEPFSWIRACM
jgi:hypothetical protein